MKKLFGQDSMFNNAFVSGTNKHKASFDPRSSNLQTRQPSESVGVWEGSVPPAAAVTEVENMLVRCPNYEEVPQL